VTVAGERPSRRRRGLVAAGVAGLLIVVWAGLGVRRLAPEREFGVLAGPWPGLPRLVTSRRIVLAPPGLVRLGVFPREARELPLPKASDALLASAEGGHFGLVGTAVVRADPAQLGALAGSRRAGLPEILLDAVRASAPALGEVRAGDEPVSTRTRAFEHRLVEELASRGCVLQSFRLAAFDDLTAAAARVPLAPDVRVLVVGLDGADWEIVDPLMAAGRMPNLLHLVRRGVRAKFLSISPILSPVVWTSIATGVEPARHGVLDFLAPAPDGRSEPVTSRARKVPTVWEILSDAGAEVSVTGWWATWPADRVRGALVTDRVAYQLFGFSSDERASSGKTWPPELYDSVRPLIVSPTSVAWSEIEPYLDGPRRRPEDFDPEERKLLDEFRTLLASGKTYRDIALATRRDRSPRFEAVYFEGTDTVGHLFMPYRPPKLPSVGRDRFASFHAVVDRYYETADAMLGRLLEGREDWIVIVVSDHGFASDATRPLTTDSRIGHGAAADWHRRFGIFVMSGPGVRSGARLEEASVYDIAPTILTLFHQPVPRSWPGHVLASALEPAFLASRPVTFRTDDPPRHRDGEDSDEQSPEAAELRAKLESLGYVASSASAPMTTKNNTGVTLLAEGKFDEAAAAFRDAIRDEPGQPTLWVNLGIALRQSGNIEEARRLFEKALPIAATRRAAGHQLAQLDLDAGDLPAAERHLREVLASEPGAAEVRNSLGLVLERRGRPAEAEEQYLTAVRLDANAAEPRNNLGNLARQARRDDDAMRWYEAAIAADPYFMGAYNNLALLYQDQGRRDKAIELYGRAVEKAPKNAVVMNNLASLYFASGDNEGARALWRRASETDPKYASPVNNLAGLALSEGKYDEAAVLLDKALSLDPKYGDARINKSLLAEQRGDVDGARRELAEAAKDPRSFAVARMKLGLLELGAGRPRPAAAALEEARRRLGDRPDVLNPLGDAYARLGQLERAGEAWGRSVAVNPNQPRVREALEQLKQAK